MLFTAFLNRAPTRTVSVRGTESFCFGLHPKTFGILVPQLGTRTHDPCSGSMESEPLGPQGSPEQRALKGPHRLLSVTGLVHTPHTDLHWKVLHLEEWFSTGSDAAPGDISSVWRRVWSSSWARGSRWHQVSRGHAYRSAASSAPDNREFLAPDVNGAKEKAHALWVSTHCFSQAPQRPWGHEDE